MSTPCHRCGTPAVLAEGSDGLCDVCRALPARQTVDHNFTVDEVALAEGPELDDLPAIPGYEVLEEIGRGGMGVVYKARQVSLDRLVAIKVILSGEHSAPETRERFRREARLAARLHHPGIVPVHDVGEVNGLPYFTMEYVDGGNLAEWLRPGPLGFAEAAGLVEQLARAAGAAHEAGLVHRDLKPGNVLLDRERTPRITDFGLARQSQERGQTASGAIVGTPSYMAPEQARGEGGGKVGPAADVYALGAVLYECLTGRPPFVGSTTLETLAQVIDAEPTPPRQLRPGCPRDLETICLHCLNKSPSRRYKSAVALADDLRRFLSGEPVQARPVGALERAVNWAWRRPALAALLVLTALFLACGLAFLAAFAQQAEQNRRAERELRLDAEAARLSEQQQREKVQEALGAAKKAQAGLERALYSNLITLADREQASFNLGRAAGLLKDCPPALRHWEWGYLARRVDLADRTTEAGKHPVVSLARSPDGALLAVGVGEAHQQAPVGEVQLRDARSGRLVRTLPVGMAAVTGLRFSRDGTRVTGVGCAIDMLALATHRLPLEEVASCELRAWDVRTGQVLLRRPNVTAIAESADGTLAATARLDGRVEVRRTSGRRELLFRSLPRGGLIGGLRFSPCGRWLAGDWQQMFGEGGLYQFETTVWALPGGREAHAVAGGCTSAFSRDGRHLITGQKEGNIEVHDLTTRTRSLVLRGHGGPVTRLVFAPQALKGPDSGRHLASASMDQTVRLWDVKAGKQAHVLSGHTGAVLGLAFSADGKQLYSGALDRTVKTWAVTGAGTRSFEAAVTPGGHLAFSPDSRYVMLASLQSSRVWDLKENRELPAFRGGLMCLAVACRAGRMAMAFPGEVRLFDTRALAGGGGKATRTFPVKGPGGPVSLALSPDGALLAIALMKRGGQPADGGLVVLDVRAGKQLWADRRLGDTIGAVSFSPSGKQLALVSAYGALELRGSRDGKLERVLRRRAQFAGNVLALRGLAYSPDGKVLAEAGDFIPGQGKQGEVRLWALSTGQARTLKGHSGIACAVAFSPDGKRLASASVATERLGVGEVKLWDVATGADMLGLEGVMAVAFSPDGLKLATVGLRLAEVDSPSIVVREAKPWK